MRIPGIGVRSVRKIASARRVHSLDFPDLKKLGVVLKRAQYFITCKGKYYGDVRFREDFIRERLVNNPSNSLYSSNSVNNYEQLSFLTSTPAIYRPDDSLSRIHGEF
jgi:Predicted DNA-binding protein with the Helix-hairpin-helix motif